jgi:hypothetical protein
VVDDFVGGRTEQFPLDARMAAVADDEQVGANLECEVRNGLCGVTRAHLGMRNQTRRGRTVYCV